MNKFVFAIFVITFFGNYKVSAEPISLCPPTGTATLASSNPSVSSTNLCQGTTKATNNNIIYKFSLTINSSGNVVLSSVSFTTTGTYAAGDISKFQLWINTSGDVFGSATQLGSDIASSLGTGAHTFSSLAQTIVKSTTAYFWVTADISASATNNNTLTVSAMTTADLTFSTGNKAGSAFASGQHTILGPDVTLASNNPSVAAGNVAISSTKNAIYRFTLAVTATSATLTGLSFTTAGTYAEADITKFQLWFNASSDDIGSASQISTDLTSSLGAGSHSFSAFSQAISSGTTGYFWITTNIGSSPTIGNNIYVSAITTSNLTFSCGLKSGSASAGGIQTICPAVALTSNNPAITSGNITPGTIKNPIYRFSIIPTGNATMTELSFTTTGTYTETDITKFQLWYNTTDNISDGASQISSDITTSLGTGSHSFSAFSQAISSGNTGYFWITSNIASFGTATVDNTIAVSAITSGNLSFSYAAISGTAYDGGTQIISSTTISNTGKIVLSGSGMINISGNISNSTGAEIIPYGGTTSKIKLCGTTSQQITNSSSSPLSLNDLEIDNSAGVSIISGDVEINGTLTLTNGKINTSSNTLIIENSSTNAITGYSSSNYINGILKRKVVTGSYDFPVGTSAYYELANINLVASAITYLTTSFTADNIGTDISGLGISVGGVNITTRLDYGWWTISPESGSATNYDVTLTSRNHTNGGSNAAQHCVLKGTGSSESWASLGTHSSLTQSGTGTNPVTAKRTALSSFSDFCIARSTSDPLPVALLSFFARCDTNNKIVLNWLTASETNNDFFTIERSENAEFFIPIGTVKGAGNSNTNLKYEFIDNPEPLQNNLNNKTFYYRLKQTDYNGKYTYSDIININCYEEEKYMKLISIQPNPASTDVDIVIVSPNDGKIKVIIYDNNGRLLNITLYDITAGQTFNNLDIQKLNKGIYIFYVTTADGTLIGSRHIIKN